MTTPDTAPARRRGLLARFAAIDDGVIIRTAFFAMLAGTIGVLWVDYRELADMQLSDTASMPDMPILPAFDPDSPATPAGPAVTSDPALLGQPLTVALGAGGVLQLNGTIDPGSFARVEAEVAARGEYIRSVALDSPGGAVDDAIRIGSLFLEKGYTTSVAPGALCASSCPLVLAGGKVREASAQSAIGVHQIYSTVRGTPPTGMRAIGDAMADVQRTTAQITRYLETTGVDPAVWLNALETPPDRLYYLSVEELDKFRLITRFVD